MVAMYQNIMANSQEGYSYSEIDSIDIQVMSYTTYAADVNFTSCNASNEAVLEGKSIYLFGKQSGGWKMFSMIQAERVTCSQPNPLKKCQPILKSIEIEAMIFLLGPFFALAG